MAACPPPPGVHRDQGHLVGSRRPRPVGPDTPLLTDDCAPADLYRAEPAGGGDWAPLLRTIWYTVIGGETY